MTEKELKDRFRRFALRIIELARRPPHDRTGDVIARQIIKSGTSSGANYRAACRAKSRADFAAKLAIVEEELDETRYWLELLVGARMMEKTEAAPLAREADDLTAIIVCSIKKTRLPAKTK